MPADWVSTLGGLDVRTRAVYQAYLRERDRGPRVEAMPGCKLYDVVQQRSRAYLSESRGCCEAPAKMVEHESGRCMAGKRLLVGIPSFGDAPRTWELLAIVLRSLDHARRAGGVLIEVGLDLTHEPPPSFRVPDGLPVSTWRHGSGSAQASRCCSLAGLYRQRFWAASAAGRHDYYMMIDNDVNVSRENLEALCVHSHRLAGTNLMPGLLRCGRRHLLCCPASFSVASATTATAAAPSATAATCIRPPPPHAHLQVRDAHGRTRGDALSARPHAALAAAHLGRAPPRRRALRRAAQPDAGLLLPARRAPRVRAAQD